MRKTFYLLGVALLTALMTPVGATALETQYVGKVTAPEIEPGWVGTLRVGANLNFTHNANVVGQENGSAVTLGASFDGMISYSRNGHDWRNTLSILETFTYGPPIKQFLKTADRLLFESIYFYKPKKFPWMGPFARFVLDTSIFENTDYRAEMSNYVYKGEIDPNTGTDKVVKGKKLHLSDSFLPLTLKESVGAFARPVGKEEVEVLIRAGFGSHQVFANGQYAMGDVRENGDLEVLRLKNYAQAGFEAAIVVQGAFYDKKLTYKVFAETMIPSIRQKEAGDTRSAASLTNAELGAILSFKLFSWASLDYTFKALRQPQLIDEWQLQNMLLLTFAYSYTKKSAVPEAATEAPAADAPATEAPTTEASAADAAVPEAPATDAPATDAPAPEAPTTEAPAADAPTP